MLHPTELNSSKRARIKPKTLTIWPLTENVATPRFRAIELNAYIYGEEKGDKQ